MDNSSVNPSLCPLCGNNNDCGVLAGNETCWCFNQPIPIELLEEIPAEARGIACVCRFCASSKNALARALQQMAELLRRR